MRTRARIHRRSGDPHGSPRGNADKPSTQLSHFRLRLLQPIGHPHLAVHRRRRGEMLLRLLALAGAPGELAEAEVAVGDEWAHAKLCGECQRLTVRALGVVRT